jgi:hypothetical protein
MTNKIDAPIAKAQLLIRKPVAQVFEALIDPAITSPFWFSKGSGRLETGKRIRWDWEMYGHHTYVKVKAIERTSDFSSNGTDLQIRPRSSGHAKTMAIIRPLSSSRIGVSGELTIQSWPRRLIQLEALRSFSRL